MKKRGLYILIGILVLVIILAVIVYPYRNAILLNFVKTPVTSDKILSKIVLPQGFKIDSFAKLEDARVIFVKNNTVFVSLTSSGKIVALVDENNSGKATKEITFIEGLNKPHGIEFYNGWFYIAEEDKVIRVKEKDSSLTADLTTIENITDLPFGAGHFTRSLKIYNGTLLVSIGSSCNVCNEADWKRASIIQCDLENKNCSLFAKGLRNSVCMTINNGKIYAVDNGRDLLGDNIPPDEVNIIEKGKNYGWPICYGQNIHDTEFDKNVYIRNPCEEPFETPSFIDLQAHSAPLGIVFYEGDEFPKDYRGKMFVTFHGSWNRNIPTGYKIVVIDPTNKKIEDFATGWLDSKVLGRPVSIVNYKGELLVSDDYSGQIYRIYYSV